MTITPEELLWIQRRIDLAKSMSYVNQQQRRQSNDDNASGYNARGMPPLPLAAASVPPPVNIRSMVAPMVPLAASAAPSHHHHPQQYHPHPNNNPEQHQHQHLQTSAIRIPHRTVAIPNPLLPSQTSSHIYRQANGGDYSVLLARPPPPPAAPAAAHAQLPTRSYSPEDDLTKKITQRIQEKLKRLNPNIMNEIQLPPPRDFPTTQRAFQPDAPAPDNRRANNLLVNNAMGAGNAAGSKSATNKSAAPIVDLTADFEKKTADFEKKSELAVDLIRKRIAGSLDRSSPARTDSAIQQNVAPDTIPLRHTTSYATTKRSITNLNIKLPPKEKKKRKRPVDPPNYDKISRAMDFFIEKGIEDEDLRCALQEDKANYRMQREAMIDVYKTVINDVESRLEMYTKLERHAEQIVAIRSARKKQHARERNRGDTSDGQIEADCDMIRLHLKNYRMLEDAMDRIILIDQEKK